MVTRRINGGLNGYADRLDCYARLALVTLGYAPDAVRAFQADNRLTVDGVAGPATRSSLHAALSRQGAPAAPVVDTALPALRRGDKGPAVATLQTLLNAAGQTIGVDRDFGDRTHDAVLSFQSGRRLLADGVVGRNTWAALIAA
ncbi:peptidoglycan binding domain protein [Ostertagia ostertagi]